MSDQDKSLLGKAHISGKDILLTNTQYHKTIMDRVDSSILSELMFPNHPPSVSYLSYSKPKKTHLVLKKAVLEAEIRLLEFELEHKELLK